MREPTFNFIVLTRNPRSNKLHFIMDEQENVLEFESERAAQDAADTSGICKAWGYDVIEMSKSPTTSAFVAQIEKLREALEASQELLVTSLHYEGNEYRHDTGEQIKINRELLGPPRC